MYISEQKIDEVRDAADIVEIITNYVPLTKAGTVFRGLCPFHGEKTPSFTVNPERRIFHCFGCGVGGNVFRFLMMHKGISFPEAVSELAQRYGIEMPRGGDTPSGRGSNKAALYKALSWAQDYFETELWSDEGAHPRYYLSARGLEDEIVREYRLGWAPSGWDNLRRNLEKKRVPVDILEKAGLIKPRRQGRGFYDTFRGRIICPIFDIDGHIVAFGGRLLEEAEGQAKYLNSPETPVYVKSRVLYGLDRSRPFIRERRSVLIVEGYFDLLSLAAHGVRHSVATLGTALTAQHLNLLKGYVDQVVLFFDADEAGRIAAARALPLILSADLEGRVMILPEGHDPDTFIREYGPEAVNDEEKKAVPLLDYYLDQTIARHSDTLAGKSRIVQDVLSVLSRVDGPARQDLLRRALAERIGVSEDALRLSERRRQTETTKDDQSEKDSDRVSADFEIETIRLVLLHPETAEAILSNDLESLMNGKSARKIYRTMYRQFVDSGNVSIEELVGLLEPDDADLVSGLAMSDDGLSGQELENVVADYLARFELGTRRKREIQLSREIKEAQETGDNHRLFGLLAEKSRLVKVQNPDVS